MGVRVSEKIPPDPVEVYWPNSNYGNARAMKLYAHYPLDKPVRAVIPHGVFFEKDYVFPGEAEAPGTPCVLNWPPSRDEIWSTYKEVIPCSAPYLYAHEVYPHAPQRRGTIVMPQHTTTLYDVEFDWWSFSDSLRELPKPVTVLLYYNDILRGADKYFPGMVKTCGHVNDHRFLQKLVWFLTGAEYVVSNDIGSYSLYSSTAYNRNLGETHEDGGAKFRLISDPPRMYINELGIEGGYAGIFHNSEDRHPDEKAGVAELTELFKKPLDEPITPEQRNKVDWYLRRDAFKTPEGLYADLEYCEQRWKDRHKR